MSLCKTMFLGIFLVAAAQINASEMAFFTNNQISIFVDSDSEMRATIYWPGSEPGSTLGHVHFVLEDRIFDRSRTKVLINEILRIHHDMEYPQRSFLYLGSFDRRVFEVHFWQGKGGNTPGMSLIFKDAVAAESIGFKAGRDYSGFSHKRGPQRVSDVQFCARALR